jgi:hypothetical protein
MGLDRYFPAALVVGTAASIRALLPCWYIAPCDTAQLYSPLRPVDSR